MSSWNGIDWRGRCRQGAAERRRGGPAGHTPLSACGIFFLSILLLPHILLAKSFDTEFLEGMVIKSASEEAQTVPPSHDGKIDQDSERALFDVYLDEDRPFVKEHVLQVLEESVELIQIDSTGDLIIEAYCDRRGSSAYSLALGHRRARQIREFVQDLGIPRSQIHSVSYGNENPKCRETTNSCWEENVRIQSTFRYLAITEPKLGCLGRLRVQGNDLQFRNERARQFLQKIRLAPTKTKSSVALSSPTTYQ